MIRRPPRSTQSRSSAASDVYKRQHRPPADEHGGDGAQAEAHVGEQRLVVGIDDVLEDHLVEADAGAPGDLPEAAHAGRDLEPAAVPRLVGGDLVPVSY